LETDMTDRLDAMLTEFRSAPTDRDLSQLEPSVWQRIGPAEAALPLSGWRLPAMSALIAMAVGVAASTATASPSPEISAFSPSIALAPSTLLEAAR
jgi:hypothetical protein